MADCLEHAGIVADIRAICTKMDERKEQANIRFKAIEQAVEVANKVMDRRLEGMNEFREQLTHQANTFIPRSEFNVQHEKVVDDIKRIDATASEAAGGRKWTDYIITVIISAFVALLIMLSKSHLG